MRRFETIKDKKKLEKEMKKKKKGKKLTCLLRILAVIGRYGPHLMIVIFVTQNNFQNGPGISDRLLGFYPTFLLAVYSPPGRSPEKAELHLLLYVPSLSRWSPHLPQYSVHTSGCQ